MAVLGDTETEHKADGATKRQQYERKYAVVMHQRVHCAGFPWRLGEDQ
jgi:hypothetical protein